MTTSYDALRYIHDSLRYLAARSCLAQVLHNARAVLGLGGVSSYCVKWYR